MEKVKRPPTNKFEYPRCGTTHHFACDCRELDIFNYIEWCEERIKFLENKLEKKDN